MLPHPPVGIELSTGMPRGNAAAALLGVTVPGVAGGVNAGERSEAGGGCVNGVDGSRNGFDDASSSSSVVEEAGFGVASEKSGCSMSPSLCDVSRAPGRGE